jgi:hypothetical protein
MRTNLKLLRLRKVIWVTSAESDLVEHNLDERSATTELRVVLRKHTAQVCTTPTSYRYMLSLEDVALTLSLQRRLADFTGKVITSGVSESAPPQVVTSPQSSAFAQTCRTRASVRAGRPPKALCQHFYSCKTTWVGRHAMRV